MRVKFIIHVPHEFLPHESEISDELHALHKPQSLRTCLLFSFIIFPFIIYFDFSHLWVRRMYLHIHWNEKRCIRVMEQPQNMQKALLPIEIIHRHTNFIDLHIQQPKTIRIRWDYLWGSTSSMEHHSSNLSITTRVLNQQHRRAQSNPRPL